MPPISRANLVHRPHTGIPYSFGSLLVPRAPFPASPVALTLLHLLAPCATGAGDTTYLGSQLSRPVRGESESAATDEETRLYARLLLQTLHLADAVAGSSESAAAAALRFPLPTSMHPAAPPPSCRMKQQPSTPLFARVVWHSCSHLCTTVARRHMEAVAERVALPHIHTRASARAWS